MAGILVPQDSPAHVRELQLHFSGLSFLVRNLTNIWKTFHNQLLSHGTESPSQAKILDMPLQLINFGSGPINII